MSKFQNPIPNYMGGCSFNTKEQMPVYSPWSAEVYATVARSGEVDLSRAVEYAELALPKLRDAEPEIRAKWLLAIAQGIKERADEIVKAESMDQGKPEWLARSVDLPRAILNFEFFAQAILQHSTMALSDHKNSLFYTQRMPVGIAGLISPWNLPLYLLTFKIAPALAMGNAVIAKPSEITPKTASILCEIIKQVEESSELPKGAVNILFGLGNEIGTQIVKHPKIKLISFTGSTQTGIKIYEMCAPQIKKLSLELGGKNPNIILNDADLKKVIPMTIRSSFLNQGEICLCGSRILVQEEILPEFLKQFKAATKALKTGPASDPNTFYGPLVSLEHQQKVLSLIDLAKKEGAKIDQNENKLPSAHEKGYFVHPTIITELSHESLVAQTEIFGPVVSIHPFKTLHEAIEMANNTNYGLSASIWTQNLNHAHQLSRDLVAGTVWINTWAKRDLRVPFGGMKHSGLGREGGIHSLDFYSEEKSIVMEF